MRVKAIIGKWTQEMQNSLWFRDDKTAYLKVSADEHEGPQFKFPDGQVKVDSIVIVYLKWDACYRRGEANHRPATKMVVRVKPSREGIIEKGGDIILEQKGDRGYYLGPRVGPWFIGKDTWEPRFPKEMLEE